jgi:hypothetical protein
MFEYELHQTRSADLLAAAQHDRLVREALRVRRAARRAEASAQNETEGRSHSRRPRRHRFARAA